MPDYQVSQGGLRANNCDAGCERKLRLLVVLVHLKMLFACMKHIASCVSFLWRRKALYLKRIVGITKYPKILLIEAKFLKEVYKLLIVTPVMIETYGLLLLVLTHFKCALRMHETYFFLLFIVLQKGDTVFKEIREYDWISQNFANWN